MLQLRWAATQLAARGTHIGCTIDQQSQTCFYVDLIPSKKFLEKKLLPLAIWVTIGGYEEKEFI